MPTEQAIQALLEQQRAHFFSGRTLPVQARIQALDKLEQAILDHEEDLYRSLQADLGKSRMEAFLCEISLTLSELRYVRRHVKGWSRRRPVLPSLAQFPGRCSVLPEPPRSPPSRSRRRLASQSAELFQKNSLFRRFY